jgi:hypothetical protein
MKNEEEKKKKKQDRKHVQWELLFNRLSMR